MHPILHTYLQQHTHSKFALCFMRLSIHSTIWILYWRNMEVMLLVWWFNCNNNLHSLENIVRHSRIHSGEKPYRCYVIFNGQLTSALAKELTSNLFAAWIRLCLVTRQWGCGKWEQCLLKTVSNACTVTALCLELDNCLAKSNLRNSIKWSVMLVFTLVIDCTYVEWIAVCSQRNGSTVQCWASYLKK